MFRTRIEKHTTDPDAVVITLTLGNRVVARTESRDAAFIAAVTDAGRVEPAPEK